MHKCEICGKEFSTERKRNGHLAWCLKRRQGMPRLVLKAEIKIAPLMSVTCGNVMLSGFEWDNGFIVITEHSARWFASLQEAIQERTALSVVA